MTPAHDPLAALRDIHLPPPISWWPPAPGWWLLSGGVIVAALLLWWWRSRRRQQGAAQQGAPLTRGEVVRLALAELDQLSAAGDPSARAQALSALLRRVVLQLADREAQVAGLTGEAWLAWLDGQWDRDDFSAGDGRLLIEAPYRPVAEADVAALQPLVRDWIARWQACHE